jgi:hypothetical protein
MTSAEKYIIEKGEGYNTIWYKRTRDQNGSPDVHPKATMICDGISQGHLFFIDKEITYGRVFASYPTIDDYISEFGTRNENIFEIIVDETACNLYFDIEYTPDLGDETLITQIINDIKQFVISVLKAPCDDNCIAVTQSIGVGEKGKYAGIMKYSYHIVIQNGYYFLSNKTIKLCIIPLLNKYIGIIDENVYGRNQSFKLPFQSKLESKRVQTPVNFASELKRHSVSYIGNIVTHYDVTYLKYANAREFSKLVIVPRSNAIIENVENVDFDSIESLLEIFPNDNSITKAIYYKVGCICKNSGVPFEIFDKWCQKWPKYTGKNNRKMWDTQILTQTNANTTTGPKLATLLFLLKKIYPNLWTLRNKKYVKQTTKVTLDLVKLSIVYIEVNLEKSRFLPSIEREYKLYDIIVVHSHLGTGKTTQIILILKKLKPKSVLIITNRVLYGNYIYKDIIQGCDLDFQFYKNIKPRDRCNHDYLICQLESIDTVRDQYDLVIMDESESIFKQLSSETMQNRFLSIKDKLVGLLKNAKKTIYGDAFITDRTVHMARALAPSDAKIAYLHNKFNPYNREARNIGTNSQHVLGYVYKFHSELKKCFIVSASKNLAKNLENDSTLVIHSESEKESKRTVDDVDLHWNKYKNVVISPAITTGVSYSKGTPFDTLLIYSSANSCCIRDTFQASLRARQITSNKLFYASYTHYDDKATKNFRVFERPQLLKRILDRTAWGEANSYLFNEAVEPWLPWLWVYNQQEDNVSSFLHKMMFNEYLELCGYTRCASDLEELLTEKVQDLSFSYTQIPDIDLGIYEELNARFKYNDCSYAEIGMLKKYYFKRHILRKDYDLLDFESPECSVQLDYLKGEEFVDLDEYLFYCLNVKPALLEKIRNVRCEYDIKKITVHSFHQNREQCCQLIADLKQKLGIDYTVNLNCIISRETLENVKQAILDKKQEYTDAFNLVFRAVKKSKKDTSFKQLVGLLGQIFSAWGFTTLVPHGKRKQARINGKVVTITDYTLVPIDALNEYDGGCRAFCEGVTFCTSYPAVSKREERVPSKFNIKWDS